jgi:hypothetical protein
MNIRKFAILLSQCVLAGGMVYSILVLTAVPARAGTCNCTEIAQAAPVICYGNHHSDDDDTDDDATVIFCNSSSWEIQCEDGFIIRGGC